MATRTYQAVRNVSYNVFYQILMLVLGFVNRTIFLYFLSVEYLGVQSVFRDILSLLSMADLGLITAMTYSFYKPLAEGDVHRIAGLVTYYRKICLTIALVIFGGGLLLIPFLSRIVNLETNMEHLTLYYVLYLLNTVASYLVVNKTIVLVADQKGYITAKWGSIYNVLQNVALALFLWWTRSFLAYLIIQIVFTYIYNITMSLIATRKYPYIQDKVYLPAEETRGIFTNIRSVFIYKVSNVLITATDSTIISVMVGTAIVGYYSNYMLVVSKAVSLMTTAFTSVTSTLGNLIVSEDEQRRREIFSLLQTACNILSIISAVALLFLLQDFIRLWLGEGYLLDNVVLYAIVVNFYVTVILLPVWAFREATGLFNQIKYVMLLTAVVNLGLSVLLGYYVGLAGILIATSIARLLTYFWYEPILLFNRFFGTSSRSYFLSLATNVAILALLIAVGTGISALIPGTSILMFLCKMTLLLVVTSVIVLGLYWRTEGMRLLRARISTRFKRS